MIKRFPKEWKPRGRGRESEVTFLGQKRCLTFIKIFNVFMDGVAKDVKERVMRSDVAQAGV